MAQPVNFFIDNLIPDDEDEDENDSDSENDPEAYLAPLHFSFSTENIAAVYYPVLGALLGSSINRADMIEAVYVNFPNQGWYCIDPQATGFFDHVTETGLERMLDGLFTAGSILDPVTNKESWTQVDIENVAANISANTHIVGCLSGDCAGDSITYCDFISTIDTSSRYAFVFGKFVDGNIGTFIDQNVKVSNYDVEAHISAYKICIELGNKWSI